MLIEGLVYCEQHFVNQTPLQGKILAITMPTEDCNSNLPSPSPKSLLSPSNSLLQDSIAGSRIGSISPENNDEKSAAMNDRPTSASLSSSPAFGFGLTGGQPFGSKGNLRHILNVLSVSILYNKHSHSI